MKNRNTTLLVIGGGPAGYVTAIRAGQLGVPTVLVEEDRLGGTCLNIGCIPSKALIHAADEFAKAQGYAGESPLGIRVPSASIDLARTLRWKDGIVDKLTTGVGALLRRAGVQVLKGRASIVDGKTVDVAVQDEPVRIQCEHLVLATGSEPIELPNLRWGGPVIGSTEALALARIPKHLVVVGAGYIGLELGTAYRKLGAEVAVVEATSRILPAYDEELTRPVLASLKRLGVTLHLDCTAEGLTEQGNGLRIRSSQADQYVLPADHVLVAAGRRPRTAGFNLESLALDMNGRALSMEASEGFVRVVARKDNHQILGWQAVGQGVSELSAAFCLSLIHI